MAFLALCVGSLCESGHLNACHKWVHLFVTKINVPMLVTKYLLKAGTYIPATVVADYFACQKCLLATKLSNKSLLQCVCLLPKCPSNIS